jgi:hypothetical protein
VVDCTVLNQAPDKHCKNESKESDYGWILAVDLPRPAALPGNVTEKTVINVNVKESI